MPAAGVHAQQGRLREELCASHKGAGDCGEHFTPRQCRSEGPASVSGGASASARQENGQAGPAAGAEGGDAEEGWSDFVG